MVRRSPRKREGGADIEHGNHFEGYILANVLWTQRTGVPVGPSRRAPPRTCYQRETIIRMTGSDHQRDARFTLLPSCEVN